jgi:hypothetical protein
VRFEGAAQAGRAARRDGSMERPPCAAHTNHFWVCARERKFTGSMFWCSTARNFGGGKGGKGGKS